MNYLSQTSSKIAYLVNQYPKVSHSFIRREILGLESCGLEVARFSIRSCSAELVDEADKAELKKTRIVLNAGVLELLSALLQVLLTRPIRFLAGFWQALKLSWHSERGTIRHLVYLVEACILLKWFYQSNINHVHAHFGTNSTTVAMLCRTLGGPSYSFTVHGPEEFDKVTAIALPAKIKQAAFVAAVSSFGKSQLYRWSDFEQWSKIHIIHCGVDDALLKQPSAAIPDSPRLVCVGRLCEQKGQLLLIDAASKLKAEGLQFKLILVGDGPLRSKIEALIIQNQLQDFVEITGWASNFEVCQQILASRAMVLPSFAEGLPVVIMEALALHRPVITTYVAGIPELVEPETCGWLIPPGSVESLATAIRCALQSPVATLEKMGNLGAERVAQQHSAEIEAKKLSILFRLSLDQANNQKVRLPSLTEYADVS